MKLLPKLSSVVLLSVLALFSLSTRAELIIEITEGVTDATSIAIVPFAWSGNRLPEDVAQIVAADLHRSGQFAPLDRNKMLSMPTEENQVFYRDWQSKSNGAEYLVIGKMTSSADGKYRVDYQLFDIFQKRMVKKWYVSGDDLRAMAHYISDTLYKELTGVRGAFSTKMVYVTMEYLQEAGKRTQRYR